MSCVSKSRTLLVFARLEGASQSSKRILHNLNPIAASSAYKLIILDEADMMTQTAQGALRRGQSGHGNV